MRLLTPPKNSMAEVRRASGGFSAPQPCAILSLQAPLVEESRLYHEEDTPGATES